MLHFFSDPFVDELTLNRTGATDVLPFSHLVRRHLASEVKALAEGLNDSDTVAAPGPTIFAHVDNSMSGALTVLENNVSAGEFEKRKNSRWGIMNVWRPLVRPVTREPLALLDADTVDKDDLIGVMSIFPEKKDAAFGQAYPGGRGYAILLLHVFPGDTCRLQFVLVSKRLKFWRMTSIDGTMPPSLPPTRRCCSSSLIPKRMVEPGRRRILLSSVKMTMVRLERACMYI